MCRHFISGSVYMIFYHPKWNFISLKMTDMKSIAALSFKRTCALNAISNESALIHFVSGKLCSHENLMPVWNFISVKLTIWNPYRFEFHFASIHVNTNKELTENRSEIFNQMKSHNGLNSFRLSCERSLNSTCRSSRPEVFCKKVSLYNSQNSQENTWAGDSSTDVFLWILQNL